MTKDQSNYQIGCLVLLTVPENSLFKDVKPWLNFGGSIGPEGTL